MSKDKKMELPQAYEVPKDMEAGGISSLPAENGSPAKAQPVRKSWSSPIQVMAKVEQMMRDLTDSERDLVSYFFHTQYCRNRQS